MPLQLKKKGVLTVGDTVSKYRRNTSVGIYRQYRRWRIRLVNIDRFGDEIISVSKNFRRKYSAGNSVGVLRFSGSVCMLYSNFKSMSVKNLSPNYDNWEGLIS
jgi:hypothetical protein